MGATFLASAERGLLSTRRPCRGPSRGSAQRTACASRRIDARCRVEPRGPVASGPVRSHRSLHSGGACSGRTRRA
eukprot:8611149-Alexandrium_andersonii.AAC.1